MGVLGLVGVIGIFSSCAPVLHTPNTIAELGVRAAESTPVIRWETEGYRTIRVHISTPSPKDSTLSAWNAADRNLVLSALQRWEATGIPIRFKIVDSNTPADIKILWVDRFENSYSGLTTLRWDSDGWLKTATVRLALHTPDGILLNDAVRDAVIVHELGHALGLPHATEKGAIMWAVAGETSKLTEADAAAVVRLYRTRPG
jgi:predicted Zn-dependent protease